MRLRRIFFNLGMGALFGVVLLLASRSQGSASPLLEVGVARVDITPERPIRLSGYGSRKAPSEGVAQRLGARALAIGEDGNLSLLVTLDAIGVPAWVSRELGSRLREKAGVLRENLSVAASHTHCAPALKGNIPFMFPSGLTGEEAAEISRYTDEVLDKLEVVSLRAIADRKPRRLDWTKGELTFAVNRRVIEDGKWEGFGVQADGPVDHSLPLLRVMEPDGQLVSVFASYACHCTTMGGNFNRVHGDWAGVAREEIENRHSGVIAMIAIGCGGDQNPHPRSQIEMAEAHGRALADEVDRLIAGNAFRPIRSAPSGIYREVELPLEAPPSREDFARQVADNARGAHFARAMLARLDDGVPLETTVPYPVQTWAFGEDLAMIFLGGEVVVDYALRFYREFDADRLWINAYSNDVSCYIPSKRIYHEGGYEVDYSQTYYGKPSRLSVDTEELVAGEVMRQMAPAFYSDETRGRFPGPVSKDQALR